MAEIIGTLAERQMRRGLPFEMWGEAEYLDELVGKNVVIVGPAGYMVGQGLGEYIDSFDVIVRVNHALPIALPEDYGSRTTVLYHILSRRNHNADGKLTVTQEEVESWDCEWIVSRHESRSSRIRAVGPFLQGRKWTAMDHEFYFKVRKEVGRLAGINDNEVITKTIGGKLTSESLPKNELISSHTGRRSFCTNMYKRGLPTLMIMSISGHKTEKSFLKYIKVRQEEHAAMMKKEWERIYK